MCHVSQRQRHHRYVSASAPGAAFNLTWWVFLTGYRVGWHRLKKWAIPAKIIGWQQSIYHLPWHPNKIKASGTVVLPNSDAGRCKWDLGMVSMCLRDKISPQKCVCMSVRICVSLSKNIYLCINIYVRVHIRTMSLWHLLFSALW